MFRTLFVAAILIPGFVLSLRSRYVALLLYLWFALFRPQDWVWIDLTSLRISLVLGVVLLAPAIMTGRFPNVTNPLTFLMVLFVWSASMTQMVAIRPDIGWTWIDFLVRLFLTSMMIVTLATDAPRLLGVIAVIGGSLGFHAAKAGLAFILGGGTRFADGLAGAFVDNNGYALGTVMVIPLLLAAAQNAGIVYTGRLLPWIRCAFYAALPLCMFAVIGTYSRGGFLSLAAAAFTFVMLQRRRFTALAGMIAVISIGLLVVPIPQSYYDRLETIRTYNEIGEESALSRPHFWNVALRMVAVHPFGVGLRQFEQAYDKFDFSYGRYGHRRAVHSSHMQVLAELGYPGAVIWVSLFGYAAFACLRVRSRSTSPTLDPDLRKFLRTTADALLVSMVAFIVGGGLLSLALNDLTWLTFGMVAALDRLARRALDAHAEAPVEVRSVLDMPTLLTLPAASRGR